MDIKPIDAELIRSEAPNSKISGFITFQLDGGVEVTIDERLFLHSFPPGGGFMVGNWGANAIYLCYPKGTSSVPQKAIYKKDFSEPYVAWEFQMDGMRYFASKGLMEVDLQNVPNSVKGRYEFETDEGHKVAGTFDLKSD